jgi:hypothetical protein
MLYPVYVHVGNENEAHVVTFPAASRLRTNGLTCRPRSRKLSKPISTASPKRCRRRPRLIGS